MKNYKITELILAITCLLMALPVIAEAKGKHLFILSGQSNMREPLPSAFKEPVAAVFGKDKVVVVTVAHPSQPIKRWYKNWQPPVGMVDEHADQNGGIYDKMIAHVRKNVGGAAIESVTYIWMQGEADAKAGWGSVYKASFFGVLDQLKNDLEVEAINFVVGRINDFWLDPDQFPDGKLIRELQVKLGEENANGAWIDTDDLNRGVNPWGGYSLSDGHFPPPGYRVMGKRFAKAACQLIDPKIELNKAIFAEAFFDEAGDIASHAAVGKRVSASVSPAKGSLELLTDGNFGSENTQDAAWVGFGPSEDPVELVIDLGQVMQVEQAGIHLLFNPGSDSGFPQQITLSTSEDGQNFSVHGRRYNNIALNKNSRKKLAEKEDPTALLILTEQKHRKAPDGVQARYVKVSFETAGQSVYFDEFVVNPASRKP